MFVEQLCRIRLHWTRWPIHHTQHGHWQHYVRSTSHLRNASRTNICIAPTLTFHFSLNTILNIAAVAIPAAVAKKPGVPSFFQCTAFSAIFGGAGYVSHVGDPENGAGIATGTSFELQCNLFSEHLSKHCS